jgi:hypothetical protein
MAEQPTTVTATGGQPVAVIARVLGVTPRRVQQLAKEGLPTVGRGKYPLVPCVQWYIKYWQDRAEARSSMVLSLDAVRARKLTAEAEMAEIDLARARADVIDRESVRRAAEAEAARTGALLGQMASMEAPWLAERAGITLRLSSSVLRELSDRTRTRMSVPDVDVAEAG